MRTWQAHPKQVWWLAFRPDGRMLASCTGSGAADDARGSSADGHVRLWDPLSGTPVGAVGPVGREEPGQCYPTCLAFSPDSKYLAAAFNFPNIPTRVRAWDVLADPPRLAADFEVEAPALGGLALSAGPPTLFAADWARVLAFRGAVDPDPAADPVAPVVLNRGPDRAGPKPSRVTVSPGGDWVASNGRSRAVVWDLPGLRPRFARKHTKSLNNGPVAFAPAGDRLAVAHGTKVDLWAFADKLAPTVELAGHKLPVWGVGFTADGRGVRTASSDGTVRSWDATTGRARRAYDWGLGKLYAAAFAPDGLVGAAGTADGKVVLWDLDD